MRHIPLDRSWFICNFWWESQADFAWKTPDDRHLWTQAGVETKTYGGTANAVSCNPKKKTQTKINI